MRKNYFPSVKGSPPPLRIQVERKVRFEETDPSALSGMAVTPVFSRMPHGRGEKYGFGYPDFKKNEVNAPIRILAYGFSYSLKIQRNLFN